MKESELLPGTMVGPYEIGEKIGAGRWGNLYKAFQTSMQRTVALRIMSPQLTVSARVVESFLENARAEAQLLHPNIVAVYEVGYDQGLHFCALEFMGGPPLSEFLRDNSAVDERRLLRTIVATTRAFEFLWHRKIPHRLPASANILTASNGLVKLINILPLDAPPSTMPQDDGIALGAILGNIVNEIAPVRRPIGELVERMVVTRSQETFTTFRDLAANAEALEQQLFAPVQAFDVEVEHQETKHNGLRPLKTIMSWVRGR